jgi:hypothetical protein
MDLQKPVTYSRNLDRLLSTLIGNLRGTEFPSLAAVIGNPQHRIQVDYKVDRKRKPLRLTEEVGRPCDEARHTNGQAWIDMLSGTLARAAVRELKAVVPAADAGAGLEALHPSILGRMLWERQVLSDLLDGRAGEIELALDIIWNADKVEMKPTGASTSSATRSSARTGERISRMRNASSLNIGRASVERLHPGSSAAASASS